MTTWNEARKMCVDMEKLLPGVTFGAMAQGQLQVFYRGESHIMMVIWPLAWNDEEARIMAASLAASLGIAAQQPSRGDGPARARGGA